ncbi:MAG TPA: sialate O-acetylesterase, partial [Candidatus Methylacidiphilales bacterium]|nr:sialate O-acetylesterase [Candidatus Methylacidiphilales bacterium]
MLGSTLLLSLAFAATAARADVKLHALFSDHAVLQKSDNVPVWGKAEPGEAVTVTLGNVTASTTAGADGKWRVKLNLKAMEQPGPYELVAKARNELTIKDVMVGEVWVCGGQSNMDFPLSAFPVAKEEVPNSTNPMLRQFKVKFTTSPKPLDDVEGSWVLAGPKTSGAFSAVGYFYGKKLQNELGVPVGLLNDCVGGTMVEAWTSSDALDTNPELKAGKDKAQADRAASDAYPEMYSTWMKKYSREDRTPDAATIERFAGPDVDTADWKPVTLPGLFSASGLPDAGAVWLRRKITAPVDDVHPGKGIDMFLGDIRDSNDVYWNGKKIASGNVIATNRRYGVRGNLVLQGDNILAVRVFNPAGGMGIFPDQGTYRGKFQANHHMLKGEWLAKAEFDLPAMDDAAKASCPARPSVPYDAQNTASYLYNGMISPVLGYGIAGVIWYQGEGNWNRGYQYRAAFKLLINDWRAKWGRGDFPFYFCQIANNAGRGTRPGNDWHSEVREAQTMALSLPNTGQAILIDIGEEGNIHPANKMDVGDRLARIAFAKTYGKKVSFSGPVYDSMTVEGDKIRVKFNTTDGLMAKPIPATYKPISTEAKELP